MKQLVTAFVMALLQLSPLASATASAQTSETETGTRPVSEAQKAAAPSKVPASVSQRFEKEGVVIEFSVAARPGEKGENAGLIAGADAVLTFRMTDAKTGQPLAGMRPLAWISKRALAGQPPTEAVCKDKIRTFMGGLLSARPEIDLNSYLALTLNHDNTVSIINPLVSFTRTKLEALIQLPGPGADWMLSPSQEFLYVTLPEQSAVAIINVITGKIVSTIAVGERAKPGRIAFQPDHRQVWVALGDAPFVSAIDASTNKLAANIRAGDGAHAFAFTPDSRFVYVTNNASDTVSVIDARKQVKLADIKVGRAPAALDYSRASRLLYVASTNDAVISVIDPAKQQIVKTVPVKRGAIALRFDPSGRFGFILNRAENSVAVLDASTNTLLGEAGVVKGPDQVAFTSRYAYVRGTGSEKVSLIDLGEIAKGNITPVDVTMGRAPASSLPQEIGVADMIAPTPEGNAVMVANTPDQMLYYYVEGMMAPMGTLSNYKRRPHGLLLINRSLTERAPGVYSTPIKLTRGGVYDVPLLLDSPRIFNCFELKVVDSPDGDKIQGGVNITVEALFKGKQFKPQEAVPLRFKITDSSSKQPRTGLDDVQVLVFQPPGVWQQRQWAKHLGDGVYEVTQTFPHAGVFNVMLRVSSLNVTFRDLPFTVVEVVDKAPQ